MRHTFSQLAGLAIGAILALGSVPASAQTTAVGPYYAAPSWDQTLPGNVRFIVLANMNSEAVLDRETGLVWERSPYQGALSWETSLTHCVLMPKGHRMGWRLPTIQELQSLIDPSVATGLRLPSGHPFQFVQLELYWSATTVAGLSNGYDAWVGDFGSFLHADSATKTISNFILAWCVRGGSGIDPQ